MTQAPVACVLQAISVTLNQSFDIARSTEDAAESLRENGFVVVDGFLDSLSVSRAR